MSDPNVSAPVEYHTAKVRGLDIFYREAGPKAAPAVLLLHGFPSSSHMFRDLIPVLGTRYRVIAPDYPGFGYSSAPNPGDFEYSFANLADVIHAFTAAIGLDRFAVYMQDYGGPIGMRLAVNNPSQVSGLIVQNAVFNVEGWYPQVVDTFKPFWTTRTLESEKPLRGFLSAETTKFQYAHGASRAERLNPDAWTHDQTFLDRPGNDAIQLELLFRYQDNVANYPNWQAFLTKTQAPTLVVWGNNDPFFTPQGRDLFRTLIPAAEVHSYDAGHFALETHGPEIAAAMLSFLDRTVAGSAVGAHG